MDATKLSDVIRDAIRRDGRSLLALAQASNTDAAQWSRFMRDERSVTVETAEKLLAALGVTCLMVKPRRKR